MRHAFVWLLLPLLAVGSLAGCGDDGGGDDDDDNGDETPTAGTDGSGTSAGTGGRGGSGGSPGGGGTSPGASEIGDTNLADVDTPAEIEAACDRLASSIDVEEAQAVFEGTCTMTGVLAGLQGGDCEQTKADCLAEGGEPSAEDCAASDIPDCENVTVDEYIACGSAQIETFSELFGDLTCDSPITSLPTTLPPTPAACTSVYERCPELAPDSSDFE